MRKPGCALFVVLIVVACEKQPPPPGLPRELPGVTSTSTSRPLTETPWDDSLGAMIATAAVETGLPVVYMSDSTRVGTVHAELFGHDTQVVHAAFQVEARASDCAWKRAARLMVVSPGAQSAPWSLALSPGIGQPIAVEAIGEFIPRDSSGFAILVSRLVSALPDDSISAPFRGLPVVVRDAWRFKLSGGVSVAVAVAMRSVNVESNPRAEMVTIIAELDPVLNGGAWHDTWSRRDAGPEDRIEGADLLAALRLRNGHAMIVFVHEGERGPQLEFVERAAPGLWRTRWSSAALSCGTAPA